MNGRGEGPRHSKRDGSHRGRSEKYQGDSKNVLNLYGLLNFLVKV